MPTTSLHCSAAAAHATDYSHVVKFNTMQLPPFIQPFDWSRPRQPLVVVAASKIHHPRFFMRRFHAGSGFYSSCMSNGRIYQWKIILVVIYKRRSSGLVARYCRKLLSFPSNRPKRGSQEGLSDKHRNGKWKVRLRYRNDRSADASANDEMRLE